MRPGSGGGEDGTRTARQMLEHLGMDVADAGRLRELPAATLLEAQVKVLAGVHQPSSGVIRYEGREVTMDSPAAAMKLGIATVYQDLALCENLDVVANLFLGHEPRPGIAQSRTHGFDFGPYGGCDQPDE